MTHKEKDEILTTIAQIPYEWYCSYGKCCNCNTEFMCSKAHYCPGCGEKIESEKFNVSHKEMEK